ncbi:MAG: DUF402 domain-containing protein [Chloracidobacterium sp.]|nr:DUF402 domain-containing protein [Chloracidobacterium sp.]
MRASTPETSLITVNSRKFDGSIRRSWSAGLASRSHEQVILVGRFELDVEHNDLGRIAAGTVSFEHFWFERWYNIFRFHEPDGSLKAWYCNVAMPPTFDAHVLDFVDLDIDVVVWPDLSHEVLDLDDFAKNSRSYGYPKDVIERAQRSVDEIVGLIDGGGLPRAA